jgi:amino acid adenylation domain-containing protein
VKEYKTPAQFVAPSNIIDIDRESIAPDMLSLIELTQQQINVVVSTVPGGAKNVQDIYPLSPLQEGMLFHRLLNEQRDTYVLSTLFELQSRAQMQALIDALKNVINRHDILRSAVLWEELPRPLQIVYRTTILPIEDLVLDGGRDAVEQLKERMRPGHERMDLRKAPLMRLQLAADPDGVRWYALLRVHHVVCDHQSLRVLVAEALTLLEGNGGALPLPVAYRDYVAQALTHVPTKEADVYFRSKLGDIDEPTAPFGLVNVHGDGGQIEEASRALDPALARKIRIQVRRSRVSAARLFHAAWAIVVALTSGRSDIVFGTVLLAARQRSARARRMLGMSVNTLPLRLRLHDLTVEGLVQHVCQELEELLNYEQVPLTLAQRCSGIVGTAPLFSALLNYRHSMASAQAEGVFTSGVRVLARGEAWTNYPVALAVDDLGEGFVLTAQTNLPVYPYRIMGYLETAMQSLMDALEHAPQTPALSLSILPQPERDQVIDAFNATRALYPSEKLIHDLFEDQVSRVGSETAIVYGRQSLRYSELNMKANQLARYLRAKGVGPDQLVGIFVERGVDMVVALLGILKAGGAYLPLDPNYPGERLEFMLRDAAPRILLTQASLREKLYNAEADVIVLDDSWSEISKNDASNVDSKAFGLRSHHLAYVIYTSGSTGFPKGVMIEHRHVLNLWSGLERLYGQSTSCQRIALNASLNFDASVQQVVQLLSGRTIFVIPQEVRRDPHMLLRFLHENQIEAIDCTPSQLRSWIAAGLLKQDPCSLRVALVGGEAIDVELWGDLTRCPNIEFFNVYGPTECTVDATAARLKGDLTAPHIGQPMVNRRVCILDRDGRLAPIEVVGEIYIGGAGIARGYLNRPELTAEKFVTAPVFGADVHARVYKTGDLGRWRGDGTIEYWGRNDNQVKIRGYRIELGEIEAQLTRYDNVKEAVVMLSKEGPGEQRLVAYVVPENSSDSGPAAEELRAHLKLVLPDHMVPTTFVVLERMPLTPSGKLDRGALPAPDADVSASQQYQPPQGESEIMLAGIWAELLRVERVGREDNFFDLGGHSVLAMQVTARVNSLLTIEMPVRLLFEMPTVKELATQVNDLRRARLLDSIAEGGSEMEELLEQLASMPESQVDQLLGELSVREKL